MSTITHVVVPTDLGPTIKPAGISANKYDVNIDNDTLKQNAGVISVNTSTTLGTKSAALEAMVQAFETTTTLAYNSTTKVISYTNEDGTIVTIDLSSLAVDVFVNGATYDAATMVLTLSDNSGTTPNITINLSELKKVATSGSNSVTWTGTGETASPLVASIKLDPSLNNLITVSAAGVMVDKTALLGLATVELKNAFGTTSLGFIYPA